MKKVSVLSIAFIIIIVFIGCSTDSNQGIDAVGSGSAVQSNKSKDGKLENGQTNIIVKQISIETVDRMIEGMEEEVTVGKFEILPFGIAYKIDEIFGNPEVKNGLVNHTTNEGEYWVTLNVVENSTLDEEVEKLQKEFEEKKFAEVGDLEDIPKEENGLTGKMQYYFEPMTGFYIYEIDDRLLVITYEYPFEGGDGMGPLLQSLRESINEK